MLRSRSLLRHARRTPIMAGGAHGRRGLSAVAQSSFVPGADGSEFPLENLPYGVFSTEADTSLRVGVRIGNFVLDLATLHRNSLFEGFDSSCFEQPTLNAFMAAGKQAWEPARSTVQQLLSAESTVLYRSGKLDSMLVPVEAVQMHMPAAIGDYTDFYSSREHATNVGIMFRGADNALQPNWLHLPVGYHGRASSVVVSGTDIKRPCGQLQTDPKDPEQGSDYGACRLLDIELEMAIFVGPGTEMGEPITMDKADDHIFGMVLMNDWSARDIQKWEYVPLGPFGAKNFGTTISPWVVPMAALEPFKCKTSAGEQEPTPLPYLVDPAYGSYDIALEVGLQSDKMAEPAVISNSNFRHLYWSVKQQLVHHSVSGCNMQAGDLLGSGTISGDHEASYGSMLELCWQGTKPIALPDGSERKFLADGDTVSIRGLCQSDDVPFKIGFGDCDGTIVPATPQ